MRVGARASSWTVRESPFAVAAFLTVNGLRGVLAFGTGARRAVLLGSITLGQLPLRLPEPAVQAPFSLAAAASSKAGDIGHDASKAWEGFTTRVQDAGGEAFQRGSAQQE